MAHFENLVNLSGGNQNIFPDVVYLVELEFALAHRTFVAGLQALSQAIRVEEMMAGCHPGFRHTAQTHRTHVIKPFDLLKGRLPVAI